MKKTLLIAIIALSSCSPKGFDFKSGDKEGVRFRRSIEPKTVKVLTVILFLGVGPVIMAIEE